ncbi:hypothetical protein PV350_41240 [Streptomyces sp. PA03-6a]|nr:hypothetical protein [Streptomyces sp. PA03-6a]
MTTVYITEGGDNWHHSPDCPGIVAGHRTAEIHDWDSHAAERVTLVEAHQRGKHAECQKCRPADQ